MPSRFPPLRPQDQICTRVQARVANRPAPSLPWGELLIGTIALFLMLSL